MNRAGFIAHVAELGAFAHPEEADAAVEATLAALGTVLVPSERRAISESLPEGLRGLLATPRHAPNLDVERFYQLVQRHERVRPGRAREHAQIVCRALAEVVSPECRALLVRHVPWLESVLLAPAPLPLAPGPERVPPAAPSSTTLATGRPGARRPLAAANPDRAQSHSVARSDDPHGDTKLSSSHGTTQERERETLATGKPGPKRSLSG